MSEGIMAHRGQAMPVPPNGSGGSAGEAVLDGMIASSAGDPPSWRLRSGLPRHLLQWAFAAGTDRREAKAVMEFVAGLVENPDVGEAVPPPVTGLLGIDDVPDIRHAVPEGTTTQVIWRFHPALGWIEILAPRIAQELEPR